MKKATICFCLVFLIVVPAIGTQAEQTQPTTRVEELEKTVRELERRVSELEKELKRKEVGAQPPAVLQERVGQLEEKVKKQEEKGKEPGTFRAYWKDTVRFETADKAFRFRIGGRIHNDWALTSGEDELEQEVGDLEDGVEFRRAILYMSGLLYERVEFKAEYDFAGGDADVEDLYLGVVDLPVIGNVRVGHFLEPFGLEELTGSNDITFIERSLTSAFTPVRNTGVMFHNAQFDERMTWALGVFRDTDSFGDDVGEGEYNVTARLTGLPWYEEGGGNLLHLGVAYSHRSPNDDEVRFRQRPEVHLGPRFVDTHAFPAEALDQVGAEAALVLGPLSLQGEFMHALVNTPEGTDPSFSGFYVMGSYFLTGENRAYKPSAAAFSGVKPKRNLLKDGGAGAWELAARYSHLDLNDGGIEGGGLEDVTVGLNWYLNLNTRLMWNYVHADLGSVGDADMFQMRFQVNF